jgi:putative Mg2+ transporter-C (MgtC) family protein
MPEEYFAVAVRLFTALVAGALIGLERSYHGRPAGFRTHALVCVASSLLMLVTVYEGQWFVSHGTQRVVVDPTRMAQGIMTGIGFLGAGVIFKEGLTVRGLTTAASIWLTAALGILLGIGFYYPVSIATVLALLVLSVFRWVESRMLTHNYGRLTLAFLRNEAPPEADVRADLGKQGFDSTHMSYRLLEKGEVLEYRMMIETTKRENFGQLALSLAANKLVKEFRIATSGD